MSDLFGWTPDIAPPDPPRKRKSPKPSGHAARPGSGPAGETCGSCAHLVRKKMAKTYLKCGLMEAHWTRGGKTDLRARDAACAKWEKGE